MNPVYLLQLKLFLRFYHISMLLPLELYLQAGVLACRGWLFLLIFLFVYFVIFVIFHLCFVISKPIQCGYICPGYHNCLKTIFFAKTCSVAVVNSPCVYVNEQVSEVTDFRENGVSVFFQHIKTSEKWGKILAF